MNPLSKELEYFFNHFTKWYDEYVSLYNTYVEGQSLQDVGLKTGVITESGRYIPLSMKEKINKLIFYHSIFKNRFQNVHISLEVFQPTKKVNLQKYIIRVVYAIIYFVSKINPLHGINNLNIKIACSPFKKRLPSTGHISTFNVNTGVTTTYLNTGTADILIYREEEMLKVLIHELLHAFGVDSKWMTPQTEAPLNAFFGVQILRSNESFTDSYACMLNVFLATKFLFRNVKEDTHEKQRHMFRALVDHERIFVVNQAYKLIPLLDLEISSKTGKLVNTVSDRKEDTHVVSYYILKGLNFIHLHMFLKYLRHEGWRSKEDGVEYVEYMSRLLQRKINFELATQKSQLVEFLVDSSKTFVKSKNRLLKPVYDSHSLRMSCVDISAI